MNDEMKHDIEVIAADLFYACKDYGVLKAFPGVSTWQSLLEHHKDIYREVAEIFYRNDL